MDSTSSGNPILFLVFILFAVACVAALYVFYCHCLKRIVEKCGERTDATIWIPIIQLLPLFRIAKMNPWMILLLFVPLVGVVVTVLLWIPVLKILGRDPIMVIVVMLFGFVYIPYLALSSNVKAVAAPA